ncbi:MAG: transporter [Crocinitomicaceae bacterium]|nr:transporter [Crocinitomicaceae bacterium]|tara:strand:+ start:1504 stop:2859 length:1356 start_codon:yes stop_codon:yes gene_type:complete
MELKSNTLKTGRLSFLFALLISSVVHAQSDPFSLQDCIQYALQNHPNSTIYRNEKIIQAQKVKENVGVYLPSVTANANTDYNIKLQTTVVPAGTISPEETRLQLGNKYSSGASIQLDQKIYDRSAILKVSASRVEEKISDIRVLQANEEIIYNTTRYYYELTSLTEERKLLLENQLQYEKLITILRLQLDQGVSKKSDYNQVRVNLNNIEADLAINENKYELAMNQLKNAMGMDLNLILDVSDSIDYSQQPEMPTIGNVEYDSLYAHQIDQLNLEKQKISIQQKNAAFQPTLSAYAKYGATVFGTEFSNAYTDWFDYSVIGLKLSVPIFSGFQKSSQLQQSKLSYSNLKLSQDINDRNYQLNHQNAAQQLFSSYTDLGKNKENLELAKEVFESSTIEYQEGRSTLSNFLNASYSYKESQTNYINSLLDFLQARIEFEKTKGTLVTYANTLN